MLWRELSDAGRSADSRYRVRQDADHVMAEAIERWCTDEQPAWVADIDGDLVGFIVARRSPPHAVLEAPPTFVITDAHVSEPFRRRGIASALFDAAQRYAASCGATVIEVGTLARDERAIAFWRSQGFGEWRVTLATELSTTGIHANRGGHEGESILS